MPIPSEATSAAVAAAAGVVLPPRPSMKQHDQLERATTVAATTVVSTVVPTRRPPRPTASELAAAAAAQSSSNSSGGGGGGVGSATPQYPVRPPRPDAAELARARGCVLALSDDGGNLTVATTDIQQLCQRVVQVAGVTEDDADADADVTAREVAPTAVVAAIKAFRVRPARAGTAGTRTAAAAAKPKPQFQTRVRARNEPTGSSGNVSTASSSDASTSGSGSLSNSGGGDTSAEGRGGVSAGDGDGVAIGGISSGGTKRGMVTRVGGSKRRRSTEGVVVTNADGNDTRFGGESVKTAAGAQCSAVVAMPTENELSHPTTPDRAVLVQQVTSRFRMISPLPGPSFPPPLPPSTSP
jgi:hypothetical protein